MTTKTLGITVLGLALLLAAGCAQTEDAAPDSAKPQKEATAWWKNDGQTATAGTSAENTSSPMPGWAKLASIDAAVASRGKQLYDSKACASCHTIGAGNTVGPDLLGVTHRVEPDWLKTWLQDPTPMLESDPYAKEMLTKFLVKMPNLNLTADEINALTEYFRQQDAAKLAKQS